jgi:hypothetical protein
MPGGFPDYLEPKLLDHVFGGADYTRLATLYFGYSTTTVTDAGGKTEPAVGSYARVAVTNNATNFPAASGTNPCQKTNGVAITFPVASAAQGTMVSWFIMDAASGGNMLFHGVISPAKVVGINDEPSFAPGDLVMTLD